MGSQVSAAVPVEAVFSSFFPNLTHPSDPCTAFTTTNQIFDHIQNKLKKRNFPNRHGPYGLTELTYCPSAPLHVIASSHQDRLPYLWMAGDVFGSGIIKLDVAAINSTFFFPLYVYILKINNIIPVAR